MPTPPLETHDETTPTDGPSDGDVVMALARLQTDDERVLRSIHVLVMAAEERANKERQARSDRDLQIQSDYQGLLRAQTVAVSGFTDGMAALTKVIAEGRDELRELRADVKTIHDALKEAGIIGGRYSQVATDGD